MKRLLNLIFLFFVFFSCKETIPCETEICVLYEPRIIGEWKLVEECQCYELGGDFVWHETLRDITFEFNDRCDVKHYGLESSTCKEGKYSVYGTTLDVTLFCPMGSVIDITFEYSLSLDNDTLILKDFVDEGYYGSKYVRQ